MVGTFDWRVNIYSLDDSKKPYDSWVIYDRTEDEAEDEALGDIENMSEYEDGWDWTMVKIKKRKVM